MARKKKAVKEVVETKVHHFFITAPRFVKQVGHATEEYVEASPGTPARISVELPVDFEISEFDDNIKEAEPVKPKSTHAEASRRQVRQTSEGPPPDDILPPDGDTSLRASDR